MKITLEEAELEKLIQEISGRVIEALNLLKKGDEEYVSPARAMLMLGVTSRTTLKTYFDEGVIERFEYKGNIRYSVSSIKNFMNNNTSKYG